MNKHLILFLILITLLGTLTPHSQACVNDYVHNHKANTAPINLLEYLTKEELVEPWTTRRDRLRKEVDAGGDYQVRNDLASALIHTGDPKAAILILEGIEKTNPALYQTASNLGTAYELTGENEKGLKWIRKGIELNSKSHESSEWIHVKILEAKIVLAKNGDFPKDGSILGLNFGSGSQPKPPKTLPSGNAKGIGILTIDQVEAGLKYQLHERLQFVKLPDLIVASLLYDLGNIIALKPGSNVSAKGIYELAKFYFPPEKGDVPLRGMILNRLK